MSRLTRSLCIGSAACLPVALCALVILSQGGQTAGQIPGTEKVTHAGPPAAATSSVPNGSSMEARQAARVDARLKQRGMGSPGVVVLEEALGQREALMRRSVTVNVTGGGTGTTVKLSEHPDWVILEATSWSADERVDVKAVQASLERGQIPALLPAGDVEITETGRDPKNVLRGAANGIARAGVTYDVAGASVHIADALMTGKTTVEIQGTPASAAITLHRADGTSEKLTLLSTGLSDFLGSHPGRLWNVHKVIEERIQNIIIRPGETFSLVAAIDAPVTLEKGWKEDLGLFGGGAALTPGAGICQSATTLYRAALMAGLPIVEKRNHSLFVDHYELFGIGVDATVFPGFHDMKFKNDTASDIVIQAETQDEANVFVRLFGRNDGRVAHLDGPYFAGAKNRPAALGPLSLYQIGWVRTITFADGRTQTQPLLSTYAKPLWHSLITRYQGKDGMQMLTDLGTRTAL